MSDYHIKLRSLSDRIVVDLHYTVPDENNGSGTNKRTLLDSLSEFTTQDAGATLIIEAVILIPKNSTQQQIVTLIEAEWTQQESNAIDIYDNQIEFYDIEGDLS